MRMIQKLGWLGVLALLPACGAGSMSGTVAGSSLKVQDAISVVSNGSLPLVVVTITDEANVCSDAQSSQSVKDTTALTLTLGHSAGGQFMTGDYEILQNLGDLGSSKNKLLAVAQFTKTGNDCKDLLASSAEFATSGKVSISAIDLKAGGTTEGTFDLTIGSQGDHVTGSFSANFCDLSNKTGTSVCR